MANHDFEEATQKEADTKQSYRKELSQESGRIISQLAAFKGKFDTLYALSTTEQKVNLDAKFLAFKLDAKDAIGL